LHLLNVRSRWSKQLRWARRLSSRCRAANRFPRTVRRLVPRPARRSRFLGQMRWQHDRSLAIQTASNYRLRICRCAYQRQPRARPSALHSGHARPLCRLAAIDCRFLSMCKEENRTEKTLTTNQLELRLLEEILTLGWRAAVSSATTAMPL
jgi:hypothetical protein